MTDEWEEMDHADAKLMALPETTQIDPADQAHLDLVKAIEIICEED